MDKEEREVLPGVFMVDFRNNTNNTNAPQTIQPQQQRPPNSNSQDNELNDDDESLLPLQQTIGDNTNCSDSPIQERIVEIENSIRHLIRSNIEMQEAFKLDNDPIYTQSIQENIQIISKRKKEVEKLKNQLIKDEGVTL